MTSTDSPRRVFDKLLAGICERRWDDLPALYDDNTVVHHPHALPRPTRLEGRDQLRAHFAQLAQIPITLSARNVVVHETIDPEVLIAEFDYLGRAPATGKTFQLSNVMVMRIRNGLIVSSHDYHNHAAFAEVVGGLPALMARLELVA
ncbi:MAG TPA: nuclear transport factor 2 family protein [Kofleriaceae bacterium]